jgi:cytochrome b subunit of formate dehydrogenase
MTAEQGLEGRKIVRHTGLVRFIHWSVALSTFALIVTGMFQLPIAKRYFIDEVPGLTWSSNYGVTLVMHYLAAAWLVFAVVVHLVYHGLRKDSAILPRRGDVRESVQIIKAMFGLCEEPACDKYLAEQRLAYAYIALSLGLAVVTGAVKVVKNLQGVVVDAWWISAVTHLHNLAMVLVILGIGAHLLAFLVPANWPLFPSMFTGRVAAAYARRRHSLWYERLHRTDKDPEGR